MVFSQKRYLSVLILIVHILLLYCFSPVMASPASEDLSGPQKHLGSDPHLLSREIYSQVQRVIVALEDYPDPEKKGIDPESLGDLLVRVQMALSRVEAVKSEMSGNSMSSEDNLYLEVFRKAASCIDNLYNFLLSLVDGKPQLKFWRLYMQDKEEYLAMSASLNQQLKQSDLEKGLVYDLLAEMRALVIPAVTSDERFLNLVQKEPEARETFLAAADAKEKTFQALVGLNRMNFPLEIGSVAFRDAVKCSSLYRSYCLYLDRILQSYRANPSSFNEPVASEITQLIKESRIFLDDAEVLVRTMKGTY